MKPVNEYLPQGAESRRWHTLINEIQMVLSQLEVNSWRQDRNLMPVNSLWFWGEGEPQKMRQAVYDCCVGDSELLQALCKVSGTRYKSSREDVQMSRYQSRSLIIFENLLKAARLNNPALWLDELQNLEKNYLQPLLGQLQRGIIDRITIYSDNGVEMSCQRWPSRFFWRRAKSLVNFLNQYD